MTTPDDSQTPADAQLEINSSRQFAAWLFEQNASLAFTTYRAGKLFLIGIHPTEGKLSIFERTFARCMGLWADRQTIYMSSLYQLWRFENAIEPGQVHDDYDAVYVPQMGYTTGDLDVHDVAVGARSRSAGATRRGPTSAVAVTTTADMFIPGVLGRVCTMSMPVMPIPTIQTAVC